MRHLSLRDSESIADFIEEVVEYLPTSGQSAYQQLEDDVLQHRPMGPEELTEKIQQLGIQTWVPRRAVEQYLKTLEGAALEWRKMDEALRPATLFLLSRIHQNTSALTVEEALRTGEADYALHDEQRAEIELLQPEFRIEVWLEAQDKLKPFIQDAQEEFDAIYKRLKAYRKKLTQQEKSKERDQLEARLEEVEEDIYLLGEFVDPMLLDQEFAVAMGE
jgi:hypothetical protein